MFLFVIGMFEHMKCIAAIISLRLVSWHAYMVCFPLIHVIVLAHMHGKQSHLCTHVFVFDIMQHGELALHIGHD